MNVLVTGGLGFIGSHTVVELLNNNYNVIIVDNLENTQLKIKNNIETITRKKVEFIKCDVSNYDELLQVFEVRQIDSIIHFSGLKYVGESFNKPLKYYEYNVISTWNLLKICDLFNIKQLIFSSSATVYGNSKPPLVETMELRETFNPYGNTKAICEKLIGDYCNSKKDFCGIVLRYFNPVGAHESGLIGENLTENSTNLMPILLLATEAEVPQINIYGNAYDSKDGSPIRDFIHVKDLASGHVQSLKYIETGMHIFNLGTGVGTTVLELVNTFENVVGIPFVKNILGNRIGDIPISYADVTKANRLLDWNVRYTLEDMCRDSWRYYQKINTTI